MIGLEIETRIPISNNNEAIGGYPRIAGHRDGLYHIDVDHGNGVSILEFVMDHFDEHNLTIQDAYTELDRRLNLIEALITAANAAAPGTRAEDLFDQHSVDMEKLSDARLNNLNGPDNLPIAADVRLRGPIHFTVGFAPRVVNQLIQERLTIAAHAKAGSASNRATQAAALVLPAIPNNLDQQRLRGYLALMYMHIAAAMDGTLDQQAQEGRGRLTKNRTQALCRVPFRVMYQDLPVEERKWLRDNHEPILRTMRTTYSTLADKWSGGEHKKNKLLIPPPAKQLIKGGFGLDNVVDDPTTIFGEMSVVIQGEHVGPPAGNLIGYALELRRMVVTEGDAASRRQVARNLIAYSRQVHGN